MTSSVARTPDHQIDTLFIDRWSSRAYSGEGISDDELFSLFEAARWAPSASNSQPWRFVYAHRQTPEWEPLFLLLNARNRLWADKAAALVAIVSDTSFAREDGTFATTRTGSFDTGAAGASLAFQAQNQGLRTRAMGGVDHERAPAVLGFAGTQRLEAIVAIGSPAPADTLPAEFRAAEQPTLRRPIGAFIFKGRLPDISGDSA